MSLPMDWIFRERASSANFWLRVCRTTRRLSFPPIRCVTLTKYLDHVLIMDNSRVLLDESTASICSKLFFLESDDRELAATALYTLPSVQGNFLMLPNTEGEESEINLELLFGAVLAEPGKIAEMFHTKTNE